jgi:hypothetical protein
VYLTDGGHIENLGIYELLKRRCGVIVAVDAEADPNMEFTSFVRLQEYARIDLGIRIELPFRPIHDVSLAAGEAIDSTTETPRNGPHCAIGEIQYPGPRYGILVYVKASLTGDENDYIRAYRRRYPAFPHESTLDQMFGEEQFEVYRALGFHAAFRLFSREDKYAFPSTEECPRMPQHLARFDALFPKPSQQTIEGHRYGVAPGRRMDDEN